MTSENAGEFSNKVVSFLKTNGKFDEFRKKCASEIEHHTSFVNARREVEELVRLRIVNNRKSDFPLTKNQLRQEIRAMLSKRKDLLAAADSSIQFSLHKNKILLTEEINEASTKFEEEEKLQKEAEKILLAEQAAKEASEVLEPEPRKEPEDIPPPPPPPPPRQPVKPVSSNDTALLMQESVFDANNSNMFNAPHSMNISDLLANVQSSDFTGQLPEQPPLPTEPCEPEPENYPVPYNYDDSQPKDLYSNTPTYPDNPSFDALGSPKAKVDDKVYNFDKDEYQYSHYSENKSDRSRYDENRDYKHESSRYGYEHSEYKRSSEKSRKYAEDYRERERSYSKHSRNSLSPKQVVDYEKYKEYSRAREYSLDRVFKSPDYYVSSSRSSSGRSLSSRERRKRDEEWYAKHHYSLKYGHGFSHSSSHKYPDPSHKYPDPAHKYPELPRREDILPRREDIMLKEYIRHDKKRHTDPYYKQPDYKQPEYRVAEKPERIKVKEGRDRNRERAYHPHSNTDMLIKEIRSSVDKTSSHKDRAYDSDFEVPHSASPILSPTIKPLPKAADDKPLPKLKSPIPKIQEIENLTPPSPDNLDKLVEKAIANIPKTPEEPMPPHIENEYSEASFNNEVEKPNSPIKSPVLINDIRAEPIINHKPVFFEAKRSIIDSILPKPKYCPLLKDDFSSCDEPLQETEKSLIVPVSPVHEQTPIRLQPPLTFLDNQSFDIPQPQSHNILEPPTIPSSALQNELKESQEILQSFGLKPFSVKESNDVTECQSSIPKVEPRIHRPCTPPEPPMPLVKELPISPIKTPEPIIESKPIPPLPDKELTPPPAPPLPPNLETAPISIQPEPAPQPTKKSLAEILGGMRKPTPASPVILTTTRMKRKPDGSTRLPDSSDTEEGEILSDHDEESTRSILKPKLDTSLNTGRHMGLDKKENVKSANECSTIHVEPTTDKGQSSISKVDDLSANVKPVKPMNESIVIKSKRDFFKARFFQPDMKIDFSKPDTCDKQATDNDVTKTEPEPAESSDKKEEKSESTTESELASKYSKKMRFMEVLKEHMNVQGTDKSEQETKPSVAEEKTTPVVATPTPVLVSTTPVLVSTPSPSVPAPAAPPTESATAAMSVLGKRKRFLNDYIASLESNPPPKSPPKPTKADTVASLQEHLPKLRIKPTSSGLYASETLASNSPAPGPPPLRKASTSPLEAKPDSGVPKCIIKLGKSNWGAADGNNPAPATKGRGKKGRAQPRRSLRSREASTDSNKSGDVSETAVDKPRTTRSRKSSKISIPSTKSYDSVVDEEVPSDNSFEDNDTNSRKSRRTRKTIKRLNL